MITNLPGINATLNLISFIFLLVGYWHIKNGRKDSHKKMMIAALGVSALFLASYLVYHYHVGSVKFPDLGWIKTFYLIILVPHIILAAVMLPFIYLTFYYAFKENHEKHKKIAKITFPIWLYVSFSGVLVYILLYKVSPLLIE